MEKHILVVISDYKSLSHCEECMEFRRYRDSNNFNTFYYMDISIANAIHFFFYPWFLDFVKLVCYKKVWRNIRRLLFNCINNWHQLNQSLIPLKIQRHRLSRCFFNSNINKTLEKNHHISTCFVKSEFQSWFFKLFFFKAIFELFCSIFFQFAIRFLILSFQRVISSIPHSMWLVQMTKIDLFFPK